MKLLLSLTPSCTTQPTTWHQPPIRPRLHACWRTFVHIWQKSSHTASDAKQPVAQSLGRPWTQEERNVLRQMREDGHTLRDIAACLGRPFSAVSAYCYRSPPDARFAHVIHPWTDAELRTLKRLKGEGLGWSAIAHAMGRTLRSVHARFDRLHTENEQRTQSSEHKIWTSDALKRLREMRDADMSWLQISEALGRSIASVHKAYRYYKDERSLMGTRSYQRWTDSEHEVLRELKEKGASWTEVRNMMPSRAFHTLQLHWCNQDYRKSVDYLPRKSWEAEEVEAMIQLRSTEMSFPAIAKRLGRSTSSVKNRYHKISGSLTNPRTSPSSRPTTASSPGHTAS